MALPRVSVVVPARNLAAWIGPALSSVGQQTYPHDLIDVVVVDDGSTDETANIASDTLTSMSMRHTVLRNKTAHGPSAARNSGWRHATGTWVQFLDGDDLLEPEKIDIQARAAATATAKVAALFSPWGRLLETASGWTRQTPW